MVDCPSLPQKASLRVTVARWRHPPDPCEWVWAGQLRLQRPVDSDGKLCESKWRERGISTHVLPGECRDWKGKGNIVKGSRIYCYTSWKVVCSLLSIVRENLEPIFTLFLDGQPSYFKFGYVQIMWTNICSNTTSTQNYKSANMTALWGQLRVCKQW